MAKMVVRGIVDNEFLTIAPFVIDQAKKKLLISTYRLQIHTKTKASNFLNLYKALVNAIARGVKVQVLAQYSEKIGLSPHSNLLSMAILKDKGAEVRFLKRGRISHAKMIIVDDAYLIMGSHNWSLSSLTRNFEFSVLLDDPESIAQAKAHYLVNWESGIIFK